MSDFYTNVAVRGDYILFRGVRNGKRVIQRIPNYKPTLYLPANQPTQFRTIDNRFAEPFVAGGIKDTKEFLEKYKDVDNFEVFGMTDFGIQYISDNYPQKIVEHNMSLVRVFNMDIEVASPNGFPEPDQAEYEIISITVKDSLTGEYHTFGCGDYKPHMNNVVYHKCDNEIDLLTQFIHYWEENYPDIVTGWNVRFFDIAYLIHRIKKVLGDAWVNRLSPWGVVNERNITIQGNTQRTYEFLGIVIMDGLELYKKYTFVKQESYRLGYIARVEDLGVQKITFEEEKSLHSLYLNNYQKFIEYNIRDTEVLDKLLLKHKFIEIVLGIAYIAKVNWNTVYSPVMTWDAFIYNYYRRKNIVIPPQKQAFSSGQYDGAFVKEPIPGLYKWVMSVDATSLYPSIARQWNIGPDTLISQFKLPELVAQATIQDLIERKVDLSFAKEQDVSFCANKVVFHKRFKSVFADLFGELLESRGKAKTEMLAKKNELEKDPNNKELSEKIAALHNLQLVLKVFANSGYGAMGNAAFRYYDTRLAEAITVTGQLVIQWAEKRINDFMNKAVGTTGKNYVIMIDTDALYVSFDELIEKVGLKDAPKEKIVAYLDKMAKQIIQPELDKYFKDLFNYTNAYEHHIWMKRENIAEGCIVVAKKRYAMSVWDSEGVRYEKPKIKITGIEAVRSSTPEFCRKAIKEAINIILTKTKPELMDFITATEAKFMELPPEECSFPRGVSDLGSYAHPVTIFQKGTPIHVKGALLYNNKIRERKLDKEYQIIKDGDKIRFAYLKDPNPIHESVISFPEYLPRELGLHDYIDTRLQYEKTFLDPIENIVTNIGWSVKQTNSLDDLFQ